MLPRALQLRIRFIKALFIARKFHAPRQLAQKAHTAIKYSTAINVSPSPKPQPHLRHVMDLERARLRHDKFLPMPKRKRKRSSNENQPRAEKLPDPIELEAENEAPTMAGKSWLNIYGPHHEDGEEVLYHLNEFNGQFSFRDTILDQLDRYFIYLKRMKKYDKDTYRFYRQVGAHIIPYSSTGASWDVLQRLRAGADDGYQDWSKERPHELPTWLRGNRPAFGCVVFGANSFSEHEETFAKDGHTLWTPRFLSFGKYAKPPHSIEAVRGDGDVYRVSINWDKIKEDRNARQDFAMFINRDGTEIRALKVLRTNMVSIRGKHGKFFYPRTGFDMPECYEEWAKSHNVTAEWFLIDLFCKAMDTFVKAHSSMVRIAVTKNDMTAVFGVDVERLPYFFRDRDRIIGQDGRTQRIFHYVKPHTRADGAQVPSHFRGVRRFKWGAYDVQITVPGKDHASLLEFDVGFYDQREAPRPGRLLSEGRMGQWLKAYVEGNRHGNWK